MVFLLPGGRGSPATTPAMSSFVPSENSVGRNLDRGVNLFRKAHVGDAAAVAPRTPRHVLAVLDGSRQDGTTVGLARHLKARFGCGVSVTDSRETPDGSPGDPAAAEAAAAGLGAAALPRTAGESYRRILDAVAESGCDLAVVPCPYGREPEETGPHSAGLTTDMLLAQSPVPLLVVREPFPVGGSNDDAAGDPPFGKIAVVLIGENAAARAACAWACGLAETAGGRPNLGLELLLEEEFFENVRDVLLALDPDADVTHERIAEALAKEHGRLHAGLKKTAAQKGFHYHLHTRRQRDEPGVLTNDPARPLIVLALERGDHASEGHVADRVRRSANPLLVVPSEGSR